jgi:hypothetical protein
VVEQYHANCVFIKNSSSEAMYARGDIREIFLRKKQFLNVRASKCSQHGGRRVDSIGIGESIDAQAEKQGYDLNYAAVELQRELNDKIDVEEWHCITKNRHLVQDQYLDENQ